MHQPRLLKLNRVTPLVLLLMGLIGCQPSPPSTQGSIGEEPNQSTSDIRVRSAHSNWIEERFQTEIVNIGLEQLGYTIAPLQEITYPPIYLAIANGELDYSPIFYERAHAKFFENAGGDQKLTTLGILTDNLIQGYQIDKKTAEQYQITNLEQLKDPQLAQLFDTDGDGKANLVGCNPGWGCELAIDHHLEAYGLLDTVEHDKGQYIALLANAIERYQQGQPILYYAYGPHWVSAVLKPDQDVIWLEVPFTSLPAEQGEVTAKETTIDGKNLGFATSRQRIVANPKFLAANPVAHRWLEQVEIPAEDVTRESLRIKDGEDSPEDIRRHAQAWVKTHQTLFNRWLAAARNAAN